MANVVVSSEPAEGLRHLHGQWWPSLRPIYVYAYAYASGGYIETGPCTSVLKQKKEEISPKHNHLNQFVIEYIQSIILAFK